MELTKYREQLLVSHSMEIEKINERHRNEIKKYHVRDSSFLLCQIVKLVAFPCILIYKSHHLFIRRSCKCAIKMLFPN